MFISEVIFRLIFTSEFNAATTSDNAATTDTAATATIANSSSASTAPKTT